MKAKRILKIHFKTILDRAKLEIGDCTDGDDYLDFIRRNPCIICGRKSEPHHLETKGAGGSDFLAVPLCREHHTEIGNIGTMTFIQRHCLNIEAIIFELLRDYYSVFI